MGQIQDGVQTVCVTKLDFEKEYSASLPSSEKIFGMERCNYLSFDNACFFLQSRPNFARTRPICSCPSMKNASFNKVSRVIVEKSFQLIDLFSSLSICD